MSNRLAGETSPYLLQHADNPVDWHPWNAEALARARREAKPILLSIGYSACHWCHVMAHECFEDDEVATLMNAGFVNIKVDREERPDLDQIYQSAHALLTRRSGGWPLTMFLTPAGEPFFGGTYFPKHGRHGLPGFVDLLPRVAAAFHEQGEAIAEQSARLKGALASLEPQPGPEAPLPGDTWARLLADLEQGFDRVHGGFGAAPKFPHPAELALCLRQHARHGEAELLHVVRHTLARMADGGIHDQLGGGFCRYSVDAEWSIPHFEKMLYDNAALLGLYADLARVTGEQGFADVARGIVAWLTRELQAPDGAFHSSLDADSEGEEGRFYVWSRDQFAAALSADEHAVAAPYWGLDGPPNFEGHAWNLRCVRPLDDIAQAQSITLPDAQSRLAFARGALFAVRSQRVRPGLDDKILTSWNALAIAGLARAARALDEPAWADIARRALDALRRTAWRDGRLRATRRGEAAALNAYLDDHAFLLAALLEMMQTRFDGGDLDWACALADLLLGKFEDPEAGGFFFTSHDHELLVHRAKPGHDNATPSGNGMAVQGLLALGHLVGDARYVAAAERALRCFAASLARSAGGYASLAVAVDELAVPPANVLVVGEPAAATAWQAALERRYRPAARIFNVAGQPLPKALVKGPAPAAGARAYVCAGFTCLPPVDSLDALVDLLGGPPGAAGAC